MAAAGPGIPAPKTEILIKNIKQRVHSDEEKDCVLWTGLREVRPQTWGKDLKVVWEAAFCLQSNSGSWLRQRDDPDAPMRTSFVSCLQSSPGIASPALR